MTHPRHRPVLGVLALLACATLWSLNGLLIKVLDDPQAMYGLLARIGIDAPPLAQPGSDAPTARPVSPWAISSYRSLLGAAVFIPLAWPRRRTLGNVSPRWLLASVTAFTLMTATFVYANTLTTAANAIVLQYTAPLVVFLLSPFVLKERPHWREAAVLPIVLAGVAIIFLHGEQSDGFGLSVALSGGLWYGLLTVVLRGVRAVDARVLVAMNTLVSGLVVLPAVLLSGQYAVTWPQLGFLALLGVVGFATPYLLFSYGVQQVEAHRASLITLLEVLLNPLLAWLVVREQPSLGTLYGGPVILLGVVAWILLSLRRSRPPQPPPPAVRPPAAEPLASHTL